MRAFGSLGTVLIAILMCANFTACNNDDNELFENKENNIPKNTIRYQTTDGIIVRFENEDVFGGAKLINNTYSTTEGYGTMEFASEVTSIEKNAFKSQKTISSITLPNSVVNIGNSAFNGCNNLTYIYTKQYN